MPRKLASKNKPEVIHSPKRKVSPETNGVESGNKSKMQKTESGTSSGWNDLGDGLYTWSHGNPESREKIAAFDLDGTLITTKSGKVFAVDANDWRFLYPEVVNKLQDLYKKEHYKVVVFTNQGGVTKGKTDFGQWKQKVEDMVRKLAIPIQVYVATDKGMNRKPTPGMFRTLEAKHNGGVLIDKEKSIFVGDAAGRPASATQKKKDFSLVDRLFAMNCGLPFKTPEEYFLGRKTEKFELTVFDPKAYLADVASGKVEMLKPSEAALNPSKQEMVIMVGPPGSGKSHFVRECLMKDAYVHVNRDTLKTWQKCVAEADKQLAEGKSVVIDNTNPDKESRLRYLDTAKKHKVPCRCFVFSNTIEHAKHNNEFRELTDPNHDHVPEMVFNAWKNKYAAPTTEEGFDEVVEVRFVPKFSKKEYEELYNMYLLEK